LRCLKKKKDDNPGAGDRDVFNANNLGSRGRGSATGRWGGWAKRPGAVMSFPLEVRI